MCRFWAGGISSFPFSRAREYRCYAGYVSQETRLKIIRIYCIFRRVSIWNTFPSEVSFPTFNKLKAGKKTCQEVLKMTGYYVLFGETFAILLYCMAIVYVVLTSLKVRARTYPTTWRFPHCSRYPSLVWFGNLVGEVSILPLLSSC